ncbi:MAG TPA: O-antigen ligase family protein, partial [Opitutaceae bacterium]|nr:O-antigen ligase family protein [Opitutaceae bacterium]
AAGNSRASLVGGTIAITWLILARRWAFPVIQGGAIVSAVVIVAALAYSGMAHWAEAQLAASSDRVASIVDLRGTFHYVSMAELDKADNNQFRLVWWRTVLEDTWANAPVFGLGFGYDLADNFIQEYNPDMGEDFTARSPHSIIVGTIGRMGAVGLVSLLAIVAAMAARTWRALRDRTTDPTAVGLWCSAWVIFTSACFGVVLEGPMGAVVFWSLLGMANAMTAPAVPAEVPSDKEQVSRETEAGGAVAP